MSGPSNRLSWVDSAKGISIILVVMMYSVFNVGQDADGVGLFHYVIAFATPFRMPEFFLISGLFLSLVIARPWAAYADRRVVHYFYFYALWAVIHLVIKVGLAGHPVEALQDIAWATIEPYGVLWFIYLLAVFSAVTKLCYTLKIPHAAVLVVGAALQIGNFSSPSYLVEQFCHYFVFFYCGYLFAPWIFKLVDWAMEHARLALVGLAVWAAVEAALVFSPGFAIYADHPADIGIAGLPGIRLLLAVAGAVALCVSGGLLSKLRFMDWLRWLGEHSLIVYLVFVLPMTFSRAAMIKLHLVHNVTVASGLVILIAIGFSIGPLRLVQWNAAAGSCSGGRPGPTFPARRAADNMSAAGRCRRCRRSKLRRWRRRSPPPQPSPQGGGCSAERFARFASYGHSGQPSPLWGGLGRGSSRLLPFPPASEQKTASVPA